MAQSHLSEVDAVHEPVQEFIGFATDPAPLLVAQYERIAREEMQGLPFYHATMPIVAECVLFEGQWLGCVLTPWMLSVVVLPGRISFGRCAAAAIGSPCSSPAAT